jgi:predicted phage baseplate assembly protein
LLTSKAPTWHLRNSDGFVGFLTTSSDSIVVYEPANDDDETVGEAVILQVAQKKIAGQQAQQKEQTLLLFQSPLQNAYDRSTVTIYANIVTATHGQTVANEVLGNSTSPQNTYRYTLKQKPLTYVPAPTPEGIQSTLTIQVDQARWHEVSTIQELNTTRRSYLLRRDSQANTIIYFGTGAQRVDLPAGTQQITATYRIGLGEAGNVDANSLTLLRTRPSGIQRVTNPIPASGGADPDSIEQMRTLAPLQIRTMQRIISLNDYENFTCMFAGVGKVQAKALQDGRKQLVHITVAGVDGTSIAKGSALYTTLLTGINNASSSPVRLVSLDSFEALFFWIRVQLLIDPDWQEQKEAIQTQAIQQIASAFSFAMRDLAQDIMASEVIALLQHIPGVLAVELERLSLRDDQPDVVKEVLEAKPGRIEGGKVLPAQMVMVDTTNSDGIIVEI